jgi:protocatechuate 3,4-dioxygenase beta subunit
MKVITAEMKVAEVIRQWPETVETFFGRGCPDMRSGFFHIMAGLMSVRNAARMHRLELEPLLEDLNKAVDRLPWLSDLTQVPGGNGRAKGQLLYVIGKITDSQCATVSDANVELWQADINGYYNHPVDLRINQQLLDPNFRYSGQVITQVDGYYLFKTIVPKWYEVSGYRRCPHLHFRIKHASFGDVTSQMMFEGKEDDETRKEDVIYQEIPDHIKPRVVVAKQKPLAFPELAERFKMEADALVCRFDQAFI